MENGSKARRVIMHTFRGTGSLRPVDKYLTTLTRAQYMGDMVRFNAMDETVHVWSGEDRNGEPLTVAWLSRPQHGIPCLMAYEITDGGE
ncbi:hypothetical protein [Streptomyces rochei]|uniref:hypothetical protein n=1 Tax=Streptomyces rochei TaxID=1928 RepID=UPI0036FF76DE